MIPDWLTPWWNWWAQLSALIHWDAVGAVGGVGVLWLALREAQAGRRLVRQRAVMQLTRYYRLALEETWSVRNNVLRSNNKLVDAKRVRQEMRRRGAQQALQAFNVDDFPTLQTAEAALLVPGALGMIEQFLAEIERGERGAEDALIDALEWLEKLLEAIKAEADRNRLTPLKWLGR